MINNISLEEMEERLEKSKDNMDRLNENKKSIEEARFRQNVAKTRSRSVVDKQSMRLLMEMQR
jgi:hypothetical protein